MLEDYLNQEALWEYVIGYSEGYNDPIFGSENISCRKEEGFKLVRDKTGTEVVSNAMYLAVNPVKVDDKLDSRLVIAVNTMTDLSGNIEGYEVYLE